MTAKPEQTEIPAPWENSLLVGHEAAEEAFLRAANSGRLAHAWLITGPPGIGKATLAYRIAGYLLHRGTEAPAAGLFTDGDAASGSLDVAPDSPVVHQIAAESCGDLVTIRRGPDSSGKRLRKEIIVDEIRALQSFFGHTSMGENWRIVIVDTADDLNRNAANALLKVLEEPPSNALILLVSNMPGKLLPTIRSRCRRLALKTLSDSDVEAVLRQLAPDITDEERTTAIRLADGRPGKALTLLGEDALDLARRTTSLLGNIGSTGAADVHNLVTAVSRQENGFALYSELLESELMGIIESRARAGASHSEIDRWMAALEDIRRINERTVAVHLDESHAIVSGFSILEKASRSRASA